MAAYRYLTCAALTGEVLAWDLPLSDVSYGPELNGPGQLQATLEPHLPHILGSMVDPGNTLIFAERHAKLMWGGLIWRAEPEGGKYPIEAAGFGSYLNKRHDMHGNLDGRGPYTYGDPCKLIRDVWAYCQAQPDGNLGVVVDSTSSKAKIGTPEEPYKPTWWESPTLADIVADAVAVFGGPEWTEQVAWVGGLPERRIRLGWPRLGTRRTDISFTTGVNIAESQPVVYDGDSYAQVVAALKNRKLAGPRLGVRPRARCYPAAELDRAPACTRLRQIVPRKACSSADQPASPGAAVMSGAQRLTTSWRARIRTRSTRACCVYG